MVEFAVGENVGECPQRHRQLPCPAGHDHGRDGFSGDVSGLGERIIHSHFLSGFARVIHDIWCKSTLRTGMVGVCRTLCPAAIGKFADARASPPHRDARRPDTGRGSIKQFGDRCAGPFRRNEWRFHFPLPERLLWGLGCVRDQSYGYRFRDDHPGAIEAERRVSRTIRHSTGFGTTCLSWNVGSRHGRSGSQAFPVGAD